ncbi:hydroxymethylbilane synthase [Leucobacter sp. CSA2]|uniref:Hydroxymethylbilane synthase n=1 Tax=Leucobacter edaphi TaxID=2796472 RepID=A0A934QF22_9MICO|nr:hydroxymethylbilane synthase [Leucobacter edaphi]MBK0422262.1 hydroxymethylbilane synthase [Leucobacter edaphi]
MTTPSSIDTVSDTQPGRVFRSDGPLAASPTTLRVATRGSRLAVTQTTTVAEGIAAATGLDVAIVIVRTQGDISRAPLAQLGGTGVFVSALREALLAGECDFAVHSLKDLPTGPCPGIALGAIPPRADARDALCARPGKTLASLAPGARVGTGSPRRAAQVLARRPDLEVVDLRGNVDTRLARVENDLDAVILAAAGLDRIDRGEAISERFSLAEAPTAAGQGALAVEVREEDLLDTRVSVALAALDDPVSRATANAEREMLNALEAGCAAPVGAAASADDGRLSLRATVYRLDGSASLTAEASVPWTASGGAAADSPGMPPGSGSPLPANLGREVAADLLNQGAAALAPLGGPQ